MVVKRSVISLLGLASYISAYNKILHDLCIILLVVGHWTSIFQLIIYSLRMESKLSFILICFLGKLHCSIPYFTGFIQFNINIIASMRPLVILLLDIMFLNRWHMINSVGRQFPSTHLWRRLQLNLNGLSIVLRACDNAHDRTRYW